MKYKTTGREMNEEVLRIINEADDPYDSDIDMTGITIADVLEEEEVEFEFLRVINPHFIDTCSPKSMQRT